MNGVPLTQILAGLENEPLSVRGPADVAVTSLVHDSRKAAPGSLFVALRSVTPGRAEQAAAGGENHIFEAVSKGAVAVLTAQELTVPRGTVIQVADTRAALADAAAVFYGNPCQQLQMTGITGTNGKTTVAFLLKHLLEVAQRPCGLIGTVRYMVGGRVLPAARTTPESADIQQLLRAMRDAACRAAVMEVSSHALDQGRTRGLEFDAAIFTNLTRDHLDYHGTMEAYYEAKRRLFLGLASQRGKAGKAVINMDDRYGRRLHDELPDGTVRFTYGRGLGMDLRATDIRTDIQGTQYSLHAQGRSFLVRLPLIGIFNVANSLAALGAMMALGYELRPSIAALREAPQVPGRLEMVPGQKAFRVFVDYAHTPDALENVLQTLRALQPRGLITVFGCGGDRDAGKRAPMGRVATTLSDHTIITSDNPRKEEPAAIIRDILHGVGSASHEVIEDRRAAIRHAVGLAQPGDIVLVAGKGHEDYQEFADGRVPFDDVAEATAAVRERRVVS